MTLGKELGKLIDENDKLKAKIKRLESLIGTAIPSLRNSMGNPVLSPAQQMMAKEAFDAIFAEQDRWEVWPNQTINISRQEVENETSNRNT